MQNLLLINSLQLAVPCSWITTSTLCFTGLAMSMLIFQLQFILVVAILSQSTSYMHFFTVKRFIFFYPYLRSTITPKFTHDHDPSYHTGGFTIKSACSENVIITAASSFSHPTDRRKSQGCSPDLTIL